MYSLSKIKQRRATEDVSVFLLWVKGEISSLLLTSVNVKQIQSQKNQFSWININATTAFADTKCSYVFVILVGSWEVTRTYSKSQAEDTSVNKLEDSWGVCVLTQLNVQKQL